MKGLALCWMPRSSCSGSSSHTCSLSHSRSSSSSCGRTVENQPSGSQFAVSECICILEGVIEKQNKGIKAMKQSTVDASRERRE